VLRQRILTALAIAPVILAILILLPPVATVALLTGAVLMGAWEWSAFPGFASSKQRVAYFAAIALALIGAWFFTETAARLQLLLYVAAVWWLVAFAWIISYPKATAGLVMIAGFLILVPAWAALARLTLEADHGPLLVLVLILLIVAADVGAYFAGRNLGRLKLAPRVSPGKTWEGALGGVVAATLIAFVAAWPLQVRAAPFVALCIAVTIASIVGDLTESMFKRYAGMKDSGTLFPGHGGVLDRIDSLTAAAPLFVLGLGWLGVTA
jgi:phosphatidate cytidylyltransferase